MSLTLDELEDYLRLNSYMEGHSLTNFDKIQLFSLSGMPDSSTHPNAFRWAIHVITLIGKDHVSFIGSNSVETVKASKRESSQESPAGNNGPFILEKVEFNLPPDHYNRTYWLDSSLRPAYMSGVKYGIHPTPTADAKTSVFFQMSSDTEKEVKIATRELHSMFVQGTEFVLKNPQYWSKFGFPDGFWPMAVHAFDRGDKVLCGRFDLSITVEHGIKCYEYNADSASCHLECGYTQDAWSKAMGVAHIGRDAGQDFVPVMIKRWQELFPPGTSIHLLSDTSDEEEQYHVQYVKYLAEVAGMNCFTVTDQCMRNCYINEQGAIMCGGNHQFRNVWKSWNYSTLLKEYEREYIAGVGLHNKAGEKVRLIDICFNENVIVLEPCWTAIAANKALLPILSMLFPSSKYLLQASFDLTDTLREKGYCTKVLYGRGGNDVTLHAAPNPISIDSISLETGGSKSSQVERSDGVTTLESDSGEAETSSEEEGGEKASDTDTAVAAVIYQELCSLPRFGDLYAQLNTFCIGGEYGGALIRADPSPIIKFESETIALRVV